MPTPLSIHENTRDAMRANAEGEITERQIRMLCAQERPQTRAGIRRWRLLALIIGLSLVAWALAYARPDIPHEVIAYAGAGLILGWGALGAGLLLWMIWKIFEVPPTSDDLRSRLEARSAAGRLHIRRLRGWVHLYSTRRLVEYPIYTLVMAGQEFPVDPGLYERLERYAEREPFVAFVLDEPRALLSIAPARALAADDTVQDVTLLRGE